jgi:hypothetical protein
MALSKVNPNFVNQLGRRNLIINGAMQVAQRYGYNSAQADWNSYDASDRIFKRTSGGSTSSVQTRNDDAPSGFTYSDKLTITSQNSDTYIGRGTSLEWNDISHLRAGYSDAKTITLSFWVKASISGTYCFAYTSYVASHSASDAATSYVTEYTVNSANTWEYKTITVTLPTSTSSNWDGSNGGNTTGLRLQWSVSRRATTNSYETATTDSWISGNYYCTSSQTNMGATNGSTFQITGVQLEAGDTATPFEHRSYGEELTLCQRYYQKIGAVGRVSFGAAVAHTTTAVFCPVRFMTTMRTTPSQSHNGSENFYVTGSNQNQSPPSAQTFGTEGININGVTVSVPGTFTVGNGYWFNTKADAVGYIAWDAEL